MALVDDEFKDPCCMCGNSADAFWMANPSIYVCASCAVDKLPLLIGDAVVGSNRGAGLSRFVEVLAQRIMLGFWRSVAIQAIKQGRQPVTPKEPTQ
jgi:hypothetical protein